jgi:formylmethanofuran dehydrogenase subunit D
MYRLDATLRHADALQQTADNPGSIAGLNAKMISKLGLNSADRVRVTQAGQQVELPLVLDDRLLDNQAFIPAGFYETSALSGLDALTIEAADG